MSFAKGLWHWAGLSRFFGDGRGWFTREIVAVEPRTPGIKRVLITQESKVIAKRDELLQNRTIRPAECGLALASLGFDVQ